MADYAGMPDWQVNDTIAERLGWELYDGGRVVRAEDGRILDVVPVPDWCATLEALWIEYLRCADQLLSGEAAEIAERARAALADGQEGEGDEG